MHGVTNLGYHPDQESCIFPESSYKDLAILMTELKSHSVTLGDNSTASSTEPSATSASDLQGLASPRLRGPTAPPSPRAGILFAGKHCRQGLVSARLGMRLESRILFLCNKLGTAKQLCRTAGHSSDKAGILGQGKPTAQHKDSGKPL